MDGFFIAAHVDADSDITGMGIFDQLAESGHIMGDPPILGIRAPTFVQDQNTDT